MSSKDRTIGSGSHVRCWNSRPDCEVVVYPEADHGFVHAPERPVHRPDDATDAWQRTLRFLA